MPEKNLNEVSRQAHEYYEKGLTSLERDALDSAIHFLSEALTFEPGFFKARQLLRVAQIKKSKGAGAMNKMFGSITGSPALVMALANVKKDPAKAMVAVEKALSSNPYNIQALRTLAEAAEKMDLPITAVFAYETAKEAHPDNINILMQLGRLYQLINQSNKAVTCYERILELQPSHADAFKGLKDATANDAMKRGQWEEAESYREIIKDIEEAEGLEQAGRIFKDEDIIRAQMENIYKLAQEQPQNVTHWKKLGDFALQINLFDHAIDYYQRALQLTQGTDGTIEKLLSETRVKKSACFIHEKEALLKTDPQNESLQQEISALKEEQEKMILEFCESRAKRYPNDPDIRYELGQIYFQHNLIDKAIAEFQLASANPKYKIACAYWLGKCFRQKGMLDMAIQRLKSAAEQAVIMDALKKDILYDLGTIYEQMGKGEDAITQFKIIYDVDANYKDIAKKIEDYYRKQSG